MVIAYQREEESFLKTVRYVDRKSVPPNENIITSHFLYNTRTDDDNSLKLKLRIAPHGNEDGEKPHGVVLLYVSSDRY